MALLPNARSGRILDVSRSHTTTHHTRQDSSGRVISPTQRPLPDNTQHSQQTNNHAPGGIRTHNPSKPAAAYLYSAYVPIIFCLFVCFQNPLLLLVPMLALSAVANRRCPCRSLLHRRI